VEAARKAAQEGQDRALCPTNLVSSAAQGVLMGSTNGYKRHEPCLPQS